MIAWAAGFMDGEGTFSISKSFFGGRNRSSVHYSLKISACNTDVDPLYRLQQLFGGTVTLRKSKRDINQINWKDCYEWYLVGKRAFVASNNLLPFLVNKKKICEVAISYGSTIGENGVNISDEVLKNREFLYQQATLLNMRGK